MERIDKKIQIVIDNDERGYLHKQFEEIFCAVDKDTSGSMYSGENIRIKFPRIWELYCNICLK